MSLWLKLCVAALSAVGFFVWRADASPWMDFEAAFPTDFNGTQVVRKWYGVRPAGTDDGLARLECSDPPMQPFYLYDFN
eukprot:scaffold393050_cov46-Prasinocladus_malaysianus.AAC.1